MRDLQRSVARANMVAMGVTQINKKKYMRRDSKKRLEHAEDTSKQSAFSRLWRDYVGKDAVVAAAQKKTRKGLRGMFGRKARGQ